MASALSNLFAVLSLDSSQFIDNLNKTKKHTDSFTAKFVNMGGAVAMGALTAAGAGIAALGGFIASSIGPASDLNETISKTTIVFGKNSDAILEWSKDSATALGMTQNAALGAAATYGNLFRAMDISEEASANMSTGLVELAGDLASFNNMDPTEVLDKLRAGLSGETEPLKSLGVNINQVLLEQKALDMGLWDGIGTLDAASKAQASYALIMEQTTLAQGDFARTSDGLANQQRILKAQFENIRATVGGALLPIIAKFATTLSEYLARPETIAFVQMLTQSLADFAQKAVAYLPQVVTTLQNVFGWLQENEGVVIAIFAALGVAAVAWGVVTAAAAWAALVPMLPVIGVILLIAAAAYLLYEAWTNNWGGIQEKTAAVVDFIKGIIDGAMQFINDLVNGKLGLLSFIFTTAWANIQLIFAAFKAAFSGDWHRFGELLRQAWDNSWTLITALLSTAWENIKTGVANGIQAVIAFFRDTDWGAVGRNILEGIANGITSGISMIVDAAQGAAQAALEAAQGFLGIHSPSKVFEMQVGWQMAAGVASGWETGLDSMLSLNGLSPANIDMQTQQARSNVSTETGTQSGAVSTEALLQEVRRMLADLPNTIARANQTAFEKVTVSRTQ